MLWSINIGTDRRHGGPHPRDVSAVPRLDFPGELVFGRLSRRHGPASLFMILLFACVLAHEFGHIFTARAFRRRRRPT